MIFPPGSGIIILLQLTADGASVLRRQKRAITEADILNPNLLEGDVEFCGPGSLIADTFVEPDFPEIPRAFKPPVSKYSSKLITSMRSHGHSNHP